MAISNFIFDNVQGRLRWLNGSRSVGIPAVGLEQALADTLYDRVLALAAASRGLPTRLKVFGANGEVLADLPPPDGFQLYYLTAYPELGVAVVCITAEPVCGFRDWHFGLDAALTRLARHTPAY